jgi:hypothetical protein
MTKLRVVQERKEQRNEGPDLRGLGHDKLIQDKYPWVFLFANNVRHHNLEHASEVFHLHLKNAKAHGGVHLFHKGEMDHKQKTNVLFAAGLLILSKTPDANLFLGQLDTLGERMKAQDRPIEAIYEEASLDFQAWEGSTKGLKVAESCKLYLAQGGIHFAGDVVTANEINKLIEDRAPTFAQTKRVG